MKSLPSFLLLAVSSNFIFSSPLVKAQEWNFQPRITAGAMQYKYDQDPANDGTIFLGGLKRSVWLPYIGIGGTVSYDRFFVDFYGLKTTTGTQKNLYQPIKYENRDYYFTGESDIDRTDYSVSFGYNLIDNLIVFLGYKGSKTKFDDNVSFFSVSNNIVSIPVTIKYDLKQQGPFVGAAYGWNIMDKGVLSANLSVGSFNGKVKQNWSPPAAGSFSFDGDVIGLTVGLSWRGDITKNLGYSISTNGYRYTFDSNNNNANFSESVLNISAGLSYLF